MMTLIQKRLLAQIALLNEEQQTALLSIVEAMNASPKKLREEVLNFVPEENKEEKQEVGHTIIDIIEQEQTEAEKEVAYLLIHTDRGKPANLRKVIHDISEEDIKKIEESKKNTEINSNLPNGISGKELREKFVGSISDEDINTMMEAINDPIFGCNKIDTDGW